MNNCNMYEHWIPLPKDNDGKEGCNNIFTTGSLYKNVVDFVENAIGCLTLIQGTGDVRAG